MRNLLLLTIDALRADHVSCYGYGRETTPVIDRLAERSALFSKAYSQGTVTTISFPAMFSGVYTFGTSPTKKKAVSSTLLQYDFPPHFPSLPEMFRDAGYRTGGFHANPLTSRAFGYDRGFDTFHDGLSSNFQIKHRTRFKFSHWLRKYRRTYMAALHVRDTFRPMLPTGRSDRLNAKALGFIGSSDRPFFAWVHYMDVHHPLLVEPEHVLELTGKRVSRVDISRLTRLRHAADSVKKKRRDDIMAVYDTAIWETDRRIGRLLDPLDENGQLDDTVIVVTADHGEAFMERGSLGHPLPNFYDEQLHVPLIVHGLEPGRDDRPVGLVDLTPTLTALAGIEPSKHFMGAVLPHDRKVVYSGARLLDGPKVAITTGRWRFTWNVNKDERELYDLVSDPGELEDLSGERKVAVETFRELAEQHMEDVEKRAIRMRIERTVP